jgi:diphthine synthase
MALYMIGIGLNDEKDISIKGLEYIKKSDVVYLENYTAKINCNPIYLEKLYGKKVILADRKLVEIDAENSILRSAKISNVAFLVPGDVFSATTHMDIYLRAKKLGLKTVIIHNASIFTAVGVTGLQLYNFGKTGSIPYLNDNIETPYDLLAKNQLNNMHTLLLLDIGKNASDSLSVNDAIRYLLKVEMKRGHKVFTENSLCLGCAKIGSLDQVIKAGKAKDLLKFDFKGGMHCLIIPAKKMHFMEEEALKVYL